MLGVSLFRPSSGIEPIPFDYEIRKLGYVQVDNGWYIAGGDKAGLLKVFKYEESKIVSIGEKSFDFKIIDLEFVIYGKKKQKLGLIVALEKEDEPNIFFYPDINPGSLDDNDWNEIRHGHDVPQLVFQPYVNETEEIKKTVFSFQSGDFIVGDLIQGNKGEQVCNIEEFWRFPFTSRVMDACVEFPANIELTRRDNIQKNEVMYIASKAGDIWFIEMNPGTEISKSLRPEKIKAISHSIKSIIPIRRISREKGNITGVFGIAGSDFFIMYCKRKDKQIPGKYKIQKERFQHTLHSIAVGAFLDPDQKKKIYKRVIFLGDSQKCLRVRQFEKDLNYNNVAEVLFEDRKIFSESLDDRVLDMVPIDNNSTDKNRPVLYRLVLGMGDHQVILKDLLNLNHVLDDIKGKLSGHLDPEDQKTDQPLEIEQYITLARKFECNFSKKCKLIAAIFYHEPGEEQSALKFLIEEKISEFIQLIYWLLSEANRSIYNIIYKLICELIQDYKNQDKNRSAHKPIYTTLNRLLKDIEKFWIGGNTYTRKKGDIVNLIERNTINDKLIDKTIYQALLNDRGYSQECQRKVSDSEIQSICQVGEQLLLVTDIDGNLHFLNTGNLSRSSRKIKISEHTQEIYGPNHNYKSDLDKNFIRRISILPGNKWGAMLLRRGGVWIFNVGNVLKNENIQSSLKQSHTLQDIMSSDLDTSFLIGENIQPYSLKQDRAGKKVYVSGRLGCLYELEFKNGTPAGLKALFPPKEKNIYNPIWNFDFMSDGRIIFGDRIGNVTWVSPDGKSFEETSFPKTPYFNTCHVCENDTVILGTEEGDILALDYSGEELRCIWTYSLPGAIRFITGTGDNKLLIGGLCEKAVLIDLNGKIEDIFDFERYTDQARRHPILINRVLPLESGIPAYGEQRLLCITGDDRGVLRTYRIFKSHIYEKQIRELFLCPIDKTEKIKLRCINIGGSTMRRLYTTFESKRWSFDRILKEVIHIAHTRSYHSLIGPLLLLVPNLIKVFISQFKQLKDRKSNEKQFQAYYNDFQDAVILLCTSWGIETDISCQQLMKTIGVELIRIMTREELYFKIEEAVNTGQIANMRTLFELLENVHVHSSDSTLIDMYEEIRDSLDKQKDTPYFEAIIEFLCLRLRGRSFDKLMPDPLLLKKVELLAFIADTFDYCPIKLCYRLFEYDADTNIFQHLNYKVKEKKNKQVCEAAYNLDYKLQQYGDFTTELGIINYFPEIFPEKFGDTTNEFYAEFSFVFDRTQKISSFSDAISIINAEQLTKYQNKPNWFPDTISLLNPLIDKISTLKGIFKEILEPSTQNLIPRYRLIKLREELEEMADSLEQKDIGRPYFFLMYETIDHTIQILTFFCEITMPIQTIESTASFLENYLDKIRNEDKPLLELDNPESLTIYTHFFRKMFDDLVVGLNPHYAYFQCKRDIDSDEDEIVDFYNLEDKSVYTRTQSELGRLVQLALKQSTFIRVFPLYLPDFEHYYGQYWLGFLGNSESIGSDLHAKISRYEELVHILNLYIMAFNGIINAEIQNRFSHRLFAHQTKEPILTLKRQLELLTGDKFKDPDGSKTRDYHERMFRIVTRMLKRSENILNANKMKLIIDLEFSRFYLYAVVDDVVKNMRKVMNSNSIPGEILFTRLRDEDFIVTSDENKIREILEQLIYNSLKYCRGTRIIEVTAGHDSKHFYLDVIDNGFGIPEHEIPHIFKRFFRGEETIEYSIDGDGLGLWVVKAYIDRLGGDIRPKNIEGNKNIIQGAHFSVKLPINSLTKIKGEIE